MPTKQQLQSALINADKAGDAQAGQKVTISGDAQATHQAVVTAMDIVGRLGYVEIKIATVSSDDGTD